MKKSTKEPSKAPRKIRPATSEEAREKQLISLAVDLAEKQLLEGTASSQVITHYLKLGTQREKLERENLKKQGMLLDAKTESLHSNERLEELYKKAIDALKMYNGKSDVNGD